MQFTKLSQKACAAIALTALCTFTYGAANADTIRIMAVGDSITAGTKGEKSYRHSLEPLLTDFGCNFEMVGSQLQNNVPTGYESPHEGYSGHPANYFVTGNNSNNNPGIDAMMSNNNPDVVLIHLGSNDMRLDQSISGTVNEIDQIVTKIWNANANAEILVANVIPWYGTSTSNSNVQNDIAALGTAIENWVASENDSRMHLVDVRSGYSQSMMVSDLIHPNTTGEDHIADAFMDVIDNQNICPDTIPPATFLSSPATAGEYLPGTHTFTGTATDEGGAGFDRVRIAIEDNNHTNSSNRWFNFETLTFGSFSSTVAKLKNVTTESLNWQITTTLPNGDYTFYALAIDKEGNQDYYNQGVWPTNRRFLVDADLPDSSIDAPTTTLFAGSNSFTGSATDAGGSGFDSVQVAVRSLSLDQWYNFSNNSFSGAVGNGATAANLNNTTTANTDWSVTAQLPAGTYRIFTRAQDNAGNLESAWQKQDVTIVPVDTQTPVTSITNPATDGESVDPNPTLTGAATDDGGSGFSSVRVAIRSETLDQWYNFSNNSFSGAVGKGTVDATLSNTSTDATNWSIAAQLGVGEYKLYVRARDNAGNRGNWQIRDFSIDPEDTQAPAAAISNPASNNDVLAADEALSGSATDQGGSGFSNVSVAVRNMTLGQWYNFSTNTFSGASGNGATEATLTNTTDSSTNWNISVDFVDGDYRVYVRAKDNAGNYSSWEKRDFTVLPEDTIAPTAAITLPAASGDNVSANATLTGTASDNGGSGFDYVEVAVRNLTLNEWYNFSTGSFGNTNGNGATEASLSNTSTSATDWSIAATLQVGDYKMYVRANDNSGNYSSWTKRNFSVLPDDTQVPVPSISNPASDNEVLGANPTLSGSATDAGGSGFSSIRVSVWSLTLQQWYNFANNSFSGADGRGTVDANLTNTTQSSTDWSIPVQLGSGDYRVYVRARDNAGNRSSRIARYFSIN